MSILSQPVVLDNGTGVIKAGMAGGDRPSVIFPSTVGVPKHVKMMPGGALEGAEYVVGQRALQHRGALVLGHPMARGMVENWSDMERIWAHAYEALEISSDGHPLLLTEAPMNAARHRERCAEVLFEHFNVPALFLAPQAILSLYASGRTTGLVLDAGDGVTHAVPVYEGFAVPHAISRMDVAGRDVTDRLGLLMRRAGCSLTTSAERELCREIKETRCYVSSDPAKDEQTMSKQQILDEDGSAAISATLPNTPDASSRVHELPDGSRIVLGPERFRAPEVLFDPSIIGSEEGGVASVVSLAARKTDLDLRAALCSQIVLAGGSTMFPGFGDRLLRDLKHSLPANTKIRIHAPPERLLSTWIGGSILASLATFKTMWIVRSEYEEQGARLFSTRALA